MKNKIVAVGLCLVVNNYGIAFANSIGTLSVNGLDASFAGARAAVGARSLPSARPFIDLSFMNDFRRSPGYHKTDSANSTVVKPTPFSIRLAGGASAGFMVGSLAAIVMRFTPEWRYPAELPKEDVVSCGGAIAFLGAMTALGLTAGAADKTVSFAGSGMLSLVTAMFLSSVNIRLIKSPSTFWKVVGIGTLVIPAAQTLYEAYQKP